VRGRAGTRQIRGRLLQIDHQPVSDAAQFHRKMKDAGNTVALLVLHDGQRKFVPLDLG
jgi:serine protease Do